MAYYLEAWGAILAVFVVIAIICRFRRATITCGIAGWIFGFAFGLSVDFLFGVMHWTGPIDVPDPIFNFPGWSTTLGTFYPLIGSLFGEFSALSWDVCWEIKTIPLLRLPVPAASAA